MFDQKLKTPWQIRMKEMLEDTSSLGRSVEYDFTRPFFLSDENILDVHWYLFRKNTFLIKKFLRRERLRFNLWEIIPHPTLSCPECDSFFIKELEELAHFSGRMDSAILIHYDETIFQAGTTWWHFGYKYLCPNCRECTIEDPRRVDWRIERGVNFTDNPIVEVEAHYPEWAKCPSCRLNFKYTSEGSFRDGRHNNCGQRLRIIEYPRES